MILVTGATGLLGMHVLYDLCVRGDSVRALYRNESRIDRVKKLFAFYDSANADKFFSSIEWCEGDIEDIIDLEKAFEGVDKVIHCAAMVSFRNDDFRELIRVNRYGTANIVNMALKHNVKWFCHASSTAAIGKKAGRENLDLNENEQWLADVKVSGYAMSKYLAEKEVWRGIEEGLPAVMVNPCVIFGPGDWSETSLTIFRAVKRGLKFYTPGSNAFVDVRDVSKRIIFLMENQVINERFLIVGENLSFRKMTSTIAESMNKKIPSIPVKYWQMGLAWRLATFFSFITRKPTAITKEATETAFSITSYNTSKMDSIYKEGYVDLKSCVDNVIKFNALNSENHIN